MKYEAASLKPNDVASNIQDTIASVEPYEYMLSMDEFGKQGLLEGTSKDIYRAVAFIFNQKAGLLEHNMPSWFIDDNVGMMGTSNTVDGFMSELTNILQNAGLSLLTGVTATDEGDGNYLMTFTFSNGDRYTVDPLLSAALKNAV